MISLIFQRVVNLNALRRTGKLCLCQTYRRHFRKSTQGVFNTKGIKNELTPGKMFPGMFTQSESVAFCLQQLLGMLFPAKAKAKPSPAFTMLTVVAFVVAFVVTFVVASVVASVVALVVARIIVLVVATVATVVVASVVTFVVASVVAFVVALVVAWVVTLVVAIVAAAVVACVMALVVPADATIVG